MRTYDSRVIRRTLIHNEKTKNGLQQVVYKEFVIPLEFNHPFSEDELVTVVRKEDLEWLREEIKDLKDDKENLEKQLEFHIRK
jgi:ubiquinone biosynthesis protein UbiJ